jgi:hypothetical protein
MREGDQRQLYLRALAVFWLAFGLITTFYPRVMELFMTDRGQDAGTAFSRNVWLHDGLDILAVSLLLLVMSTMAITRKALLAAATVALAPVAAILYSLVATDFWSPLFLLPAAAAAAFAVYGFLLASRQRAEAATVPSRA